MTHTLNIPDMEYAVETMCKPPLVNSMPVGCGYVTDFFLRFEGFMGLKVGNHLDIKQWSTPGILVGNKALALVSDRCVSKYPDMCVLNPPQP